MKNQATSSEERVARPQYSTLEKLNAKKTVSLKLTPHEAAKISEFMYYANTGWESDFDARQALTGALENAGFNVRHPQSVSKRVAEERNRA